MAEAQDWKLSQVSKFNWDNEESDNKLLQGIWELS
jgi:hypothetical protein